MALAKAHFLIKPTTQGQGNLDVVGILAFQIVTNPKIVLAIRHTHVVDNATARAEALQQMFGYLARRSHYADGTRRPAPGGEIMLDVRMLRSLLELSRHYIVSISEFAGGCHDSHYHYQGVAFDVDRIDGHPVGINHPRWREFWDDCLYLGANPKKLYGPGHRGHDHHIHAQWA